MKHHPLSVVLGAATALAFVLSSAVTPLSAATQEEIRGTVVIVSNKNVTVRTDDGRNVAVDITKVQPAPVLKPGERVVVAGTFTPPNRMAAQTVRVDGGGAAADQGRWQRIHGQVQSVQGTTVKFRADDGRVLTVDASAVSAEIRKALTPNEGVTVIGQQAGSNPLQYRAQYIQQDSSDPARRGKAAAAAPPTAAATGPQRIHGRIQAMAGTGFDFQADDGRVLGVDGSALAPGALTILSAGDSVTVVGTLSSGKIHAESVVRDPR
jgi:hypothetical protein